MKVKIVFNKPASCAACMLYQKVCSTELTGTEAERSIDHRCPIKLDSNPSDLEYLQDYARDIKRELEDLESQISDIRCGFRDIEKGIKEHIEFSKEWVQERQAYNLEGG